MQKLTWTRDDLGAYSAELETGEIVVITRDTDPARLLGHNWEVVVQQPYWYVGATRTLAEAKRLAERGY